MTPKLRTLGGYNPRKPRYVNLREASRAIEDGWLAQFRGKSIISRAIQSATGSVHSHSAMLSKQGRRRVQVLEMREFIGGRLIDLDDYLRESSCDIDIFSIRRNFAEEYDGEAAVRWMLEQVVMRERNYGFLAIARIYARKTPLLRRFLRVSMDDTETHGNLYGICSACLAEACHRGGGVDPVPNKPNYWVEPAHLTNSLLFEYFGTLRGSE